MSLREGGLTEADAGGDFYEKTPCPKCGAMKVFTGYGLMGGGIGYYEGCDAEGCDYFEKTQDVDAGETP